MDGLETVALMKRQEAELEVLRFLLGVARMDRIRNEFIRGTTPVKLFGGKVQETRWRYYGHVQRKERQERKRKTTEKIHVYSERGGSV